MSRIEYDQLKNNSKDGEVFKVVEEMPRFPGCENQGMTGRELEECAQNKLLEFIYSNLKYPKEARQKGIDGVAVIKFIIEKDGTISSTNIVRDPGAGTAAEADRVINMMPKWIPGKQRGKNVRVQYLIPVKYMLEEGGNSKHKKHDDKTVEVDRKPLFPGTKNEDDSVNKLLEFVFQNVKYPKEASRNNIEGTAIVKFVVDNKGEIQDIRLAKSPGWGIDEAVLELVNKMKSTSGRWTPAHKDNETVDYEYLLPIKFKLQDEQIEEAKSRKLEVEQMSIRPNPSNGVFTLSFDTREKAPVDIVFYSMSGKVLKTLNQVKVPFNQTIDLTEFRNQSIFVNIIQNDKVYMDKLIVQ